MFLGRMPRISWKYFVTNNEVFERAKTQKQLLVNARKRQTEMFGLGMPTADSNIW